jgi:hypothetical protein
VHDLDRTQLEQEAFEAQNEQNEQFLGGILSSVLGGEMESPLDEVQEMELASELLEVTGEQELDRFLGDLVGRASQAAGQFLKTDTGRQLTGILKNAARQALPVVGGAVGDYIGGAPGKSIGSNLARGVGQAFGLELEGMSAEDREFEVARSFVRWGSAAARQAAALQGRYPPPRAAHAAATATAQQYAPGLVGLLQGLQSSGGGHRAHSGRWERRGRSLVLYGV